MFSAYPSTRFSTVIPFAAAALLVLSSVATASPTWRISRRDEPGVLDDVLLFDAPAVLSDPPVVEMQAYVFFRQLDLGPITDGITDLLGGLGLGEMTDDQSQSVSDRIKLFATIPREGKSVKVNIDGCGPVELGPTDSEVSGVSVTNVTCAQQLTAGTASFAATAELDTRNPTANVFASPPDGFGVISDLDDTIKISNVLDKIELAKNTLLEDPKVVAGMPELYKSLSTSLNKPLFSYVSGSPFQLYPFVEPFIRENYPAGPKFLRNLTVFDIPNLIDTLTDEDSTLKFKTATIDRLVGLYPQKKFLMIGDSTEKDPETYAGAFKTYGADKVQCIWIREVDGADNTAERFAASFADVPAEKVRTYTDAEIASLADIDVAGGSC